MAQVLAPYGHDWAAAPRTSGRPTAAANAAAPPAWARRVTTRRRDALAPNRIANASNVLLSIAEPPARVFASLAAPSRGHIQSMDLSRSPHMARITRFASPDRRQKYVGRLTFCTS